MNLTPIAANMTEVTLDRGLTVLFSYKTPVACVWTNGMGSRVLIKTDKRWSNTTTRHINKWSSNWVLSEPVKTKPQEYFDSLVEEVK